MARSSVLSAAWAAPWRRPIITSVKTQIATVTKLPMIELKSTEAKEHTKLWQGLDLASRTHVRRYFENRIEMLRRANDSPKLSESETNALRGAIIECKRIVSSVTPPSADAPRDDDEPNPFA